MDDSAAVRISIPSSAHRSRQYRDLHDRQLLWGQFDRFAERVHRNLQLDSTAYEIANEGRRAIRCDRVGVFVARGKKCRAVSF